MDVYFRKRAGFWSLGLTAVLALGCGGGRMTAGEFCSAIGGALCDRVVECDSTANRGTCTSDFQAGCCEDAGECGEKAETDEEEMLAEMLISACSEALDNYDCASLAAGEAPVQCLGVTGGASALTAVPQSRLAPVASPARISVTRQTLSPRLLGQQTRRLKLSK